MKDAIVIRGARQHNLKNIDVTLPRNALVVFTGVSGSGKSSLAFDTLYAEGQRRYVESLSAYARQFLGQMEKPDVDDIQGLSPAISVDQKTTSKNPRSTVGTVTEIYDYLRLLFARIGHPFCPNCGIPIESQTVDQMVDRILEWPSGTRLQILAPIVRRRKGEHLQVFQDLKRQGFLRARVDGTVYLLDEVPPLEKNKYHTIEVVVDRLILKGERDSRLADSLELALSQGEGLALAWAQLPSGEEEEILFNAKLACPQCGFSFPEISPRLFSFNNPYGACPECAGLGYRMVPDPEKIIPNPRLSVAEGAVKPWAQAGSQYYPQLLQQLALHLGFSIHAPLEDQPEFLNIILHGYRGGPIPFTYRNRFGRSRFREVTFKGVLHYIQERYEEAMSEGEIQDVAVYMTEMVCPACGGKRLRPEALSVKVEGLSIADVAAMTVGKACSFFEGLPSRLTERELAIARLVIREIQNRLRFLLDVGLDYLTLDRASATLSGGEAQRIRLATQIGSGLVGVLYVLDEPSIGLHQRDNQRLIDTLKRLRDLGNTLVVVEHDEDTIRAADWVVDVGPGSGEHGGRVVAAGPPEAIAAHPESLTGAYLSGRLRIPVPARRRKPDPKRLLTVRGARHHNLKGIDVTFPLGLFIAVTGVSGSGKSTLIHEVLYEALMAHLYGSRQSPGRYDAIEGIHHVRKVVMVDQSPIGRTPRSNPATYTGVFDHIRELFAMTPEARARGYKKGRFSFNVPGGRCEACRGEGLVKIEMHFLPPVYVPCEVCGGKRYNRETLEIRYKGKTIADVLDMTVEEARAFFAAVPPLERKLGFLEDVGLGYIRLGQPATTLSGGEAQRVKLAAELSRRSDGGTLYLLDEPTTGLHPHDIQYLVKVLQRFVEAGDTVVVIEHNLDVIKQADWIIDLGPEGGDGGGQVVVAGTPEEVAACPQSYTGLYLRPVLEKALSPQA
ncbi:MAG: excinuclease ABC subunit UvrA [Clostridiales bacterium]|nr:excinuclease ABC subunit UvrA [Clostridiales bacterium]